MIGRLGSWLPVLDITSTNRNTGPDLCRSRLAKIRQRHVVDINLLVNDTVLPGNYFPELNLQQRHSENHRSHKDI